MSGLTTEGLLVGFVVGLALWIVTERWIERRRKR
jgi:hypothetical protein